MKLLIVGIIVTVTAKLALTAVIGSRDVEISARVDAEYGGESPYIWIADGLPTLTRQENKQVSHILAWGAFAYGLTISTENILAQCSVCVSSRRDPNGKCPEKTEGLARNLAIIVMAFLFGTNTYGQKRQDHLPSNTTILKQFGCLAVALTLLVYTIIMLAKPGLTSREMVSVL